MKERLRFFPITAYAIVMGMSGLTIVFSKYYHLQWMPKFVFDGMLFFTFGLFLLVSFLYGLKAVKHFDQVVVDFRHRIRINFFSAISISLLLLSIAFLGYWPFVSLVLWWMGVALHTVLMLHTIAFWVQHNFEIHFMNPAWFIPVVGNILIPVAGVDFLPNGFSFVYFAVGIFFWVVLFVIFLNRVIFHDQLPQKFLPTLFILIAPPAVGFIAYMRITQSWDVVSVLLLYLSFFFVAFLVFLRKSFYKVKFFISWWALTFPLAAVTLAAAVAFQVTAQAIYKVASLSMFTLLVLAIGFVSWKTILKIRAQEICVNED